MGPGARRKELSPANTNSVKQFKARIESPFPNFYAIEVYLEANNIITAGNRIMDNFGPLGVTAEQVTKLVEVDRHE